MSKICTNCGKELLSLSGLLFKNKVYCSDCVYKVVTITDAQLQDNKRQESGKNENTLSSK